MKKIIRPAIWASLKFWTDQNRAIGTYITKVLVIVGPLNMIAMAPWVMQQPKMLSALIQALPGLLFFFLMAPLFVSFHRTILMDEPLETALFSRLFGARELRVASWMVGLGIVGAFLGGLMSTYGGIGLGLVFVASIYLMACVSYSLPKVSMDQSLTIGAIMDVARYRLWVFVKLFLFIFMIAFLLGLVMTLGYLGLLMLMGEPLTPQSMSSPVLTMMVVYFISILSNLTYTYLYKHLEMDVETKKEPAS